jgi:nucleoside-triphosphatase
VIIDEIGRMELFSASFRKAVFTVISSGKKVLGTIMLSPHPWADLVKQQPQVKLVEVTRANHPQVLGELSSWLSANLSSN